MITSDVDQLSMSRSRLSLFIL